MAKYTTPSVDDLIDLATVREVVAEQRALLKGKSPECESARRLQKSLNLLGDLLTLSQRVKEALSLVSESCDEK